MKVEFLDRFMYRPLVTGHRECRLATTCKFVLNLFIYLLVFRLVTVVVMVGGGSGLAIINNFAQVIHIPRNCALQLLD